MIYRLLLILLFCVSSQAYATGKSTQNGKLVAQSAAHIMNELKTTEAYFNWLSGFAPADQVVKVKKLFKKWGIEENARFPQFHVKGNELYSGKSSIQFFDNYVIINGHRFDPSNESLDKIMINICDRIGCDKQKRKVSLIEVLFIQQAQAIAPLALFGIGAAVGGLATWLFSNKAQASENTQSTGLFGQLLSNTLQVGTYYIAQELLGIGQQGYYECSNGQLYAVGHNGQVISLFGQRGRRIAVPSHLQNSSQTCQQNASAINQSIQVNTQNGKITAPVGAERVDNVSGAPVGAVNISN